MISILILTMTLSQCRLSTHLSTLSKVDKFKILQLNFTELVEYDYNWSPQEIK